MPKTPRFSHLERRDLLAAAVLLLAMVLTALLSGFNGLYGQDSHEYLRYAQRWRDYFQGGLAPGDYFWPLNYPIYGAALALIVRDMAISLQLVSMISFVVTLIFIMRLIRLVQPEGTDQKIVYLFLGSVVLTAPYFLQTAFLAMSDMLATAFSTAALYYVLRYRESQSTLTWNLAVFCIASAVMSRYAAAVFLFIPSLILLRRIFYRPSWRLLLSGAAITILVTMPHVMLRWVEGAGFLGHAWLALWSPENWFKSSFVTAEGIAAYRFPNLVYAAGTFFHPGFFFLGVILIFFARRTMVTNKKQLIILAAIAAYSLFLAGIPYQNNRYLMLAFPSTMVFCFPAFSLSIEKLRSGKRWVWAVITVVVIVQGALFQKYSRAILSSNRVEKVVAQKLLAYPDNPIYTFWIDGALRSYGVQNKIVNLWHKRLAHLETPALALFNEQRFSEQWQQHNPMLNWEFLQENYQLKMLEKLPEGWVLYRVRQVSESWQLIGSESDSDG